MGLIHHSRALHRRDIGADIRAYTERFDTFDKCAPLTSPLLNPTNITPKACPKLSAKSPSS